ncbi:MAG: phosphatase PAP2 family protein [bacterium]
MIKTKSVLSFIATMALVLNLTSAFAAESLNYVEQSSIDPVVLLPAPPAADSDETKAELETILRIQETRTPAQVDRAKADAKISMVSFCPQAGSWFTPETLPLTAALLKKVEKDSKYYTETAKNAFARKRPKAVLGTAKTIVDSGDEGSYPSGHSTRGMLLAIVISQLLPENEPALMNRGWELGWDRVIAGVHYPSDIVAGRVLGKAIARAMMGNPAFKLDFAKAKAEVSEAKKRVGK